jgi:antitoxin component YwqK of YwqJK toxin-antitoxin module
MNIKVIAVSSFLVACISVFSQNGQLLNQTDKEGRKQGQWIKKYQNGNVMYDGFFSNDKPAGEFKRYYDDSTLKSVLVFSKNGTEAKAILYYSDGLVTSAGKYVNQLKEGKWQFFSSSTKGLLVSEVEYSGDKKNGLTVKYYPDSTIAEKIHYVNDLRHGEYLKFYPDGTLTLKTIYWNGKLNGKFEAFFENGKPEFLGHYKNDLREGIWIIYRKDGSQRFKTEYTLGIPDNRDIDVYQSGYIDSLERNKVKIADPEKTGEIW